MKDQNLKKLNPLMTTPTCSYLVFTVAVAVAVDSAKAAACGCCYSSFFLVLFNRIIDSNSDK